jgi:hypothetical protein
MKIKLSILFCLFFAISVSAQVDTAASQQDDLLKMLDDSSGAEPFQPVIATFKSTRVINGHSVETVKAKHLDFRISHRFGFLNDGLYGFYGLDRATLRLGFEYGITNRIMVGVGRSNMDKAYDVFVKSKVIQQNRGGERQMPLSVVFFANAVAKTIKVSDTIDSKFANKMHYTFQLMIARKFNDKLSLQITPSLTHRNLVATRDDKNDVYAIGVSGRYKLTRSTSLNLEYFYVPEGQIVSQINGKDFHNSLSAGFDIETGGHVFQLHFTNSLGMIENAFITETNGTWLKGDISFGFNISRIFSYDKSGGGGKGKRERKEADPSQQGAPEIKF